MQIIGPATEDEMVAAFLRAEFRSSRFECVRARMAVRGVTDEMIDEPDLADADQNARRSVLLTDCRGWRANTALFTRWPPDVTWQRATVESADIARIKYAGEPEWGTISGGTWLVSDGARRLLAGAPELPPDVVTAVAGIRAGIAAGESFPPVIAIGEPSGRVIILVEGHCRMTAYTASELVEGLEIIYGSAPLTRIMDWYWFPKPKR